MNREALLVLAFRAIDDADARSVLSDALQEAGIVVAPDALANEDGWREHGAEARAFAAEAICGEWPTRWPLAKECVYGAERGDGWWGYVEGNVPVQGFGSVDGHFWYFRARGEHWSFDVFEAPYPENAKPYEVRLPDGPREWGTYDAWGDRPYAAGWMS